MKKFTPENRFPARSDVRAPLIEPLRQKSLMRRCRIAAEVSEEEAARYAGVTVRTLRGWEQGSGERPPMETYIRLAMIYDAPEMVTELLRLGGWRAITSEDELERENEELRAKLVRVKEAAA